MKKMILVSFLVLFIPAMVCGQNRVETPLWNVGDKWNLTGDVIVSVDNADASTYEVKYTTGVGKVILIYDKSSLNRLYVVSRDKRVKYDIRNRRLFNFPLEIGKSWTDKFIPVTGSSTGQESITETFTPLGWEDIQTKAGKFRAVKLEYKSETTGQAAGRPKEGKAWYWYSPDVKHMVKCQYDKTDYWEAMLDWEVTSFKLMK